MRIVAKARFTRVFALFGALHSLACSSDAAPSSASAGSSGMAGTSGASGSGGASSNADAVVGSFITSLIGATESDAAYTTVSGKVYDGATPLTVAWDLRSSSGGCQLLEPRAPFCDPACSNGAVCVEDDQCVGYPTAQDLGPVVMKGLGDADITMKPVASSYSLPGDLTLPYPPAAEGAAQSVEVAGGPFGAFSIASKMVAPLVSEGTLTISDGKPLDLDWNVPSDQTLARMQIKIDISHHGGTKGKIECDVEDSGKLQVSAALISSLIQLGVAGFPSVSLMRVATGSAAIAPGKVTFQVLSSATRVLVVSGVQSCNTASDCPTGKACKQDLTCEP